jgi:hypothetical protein
MLYALWLLFHPDRLLKVNPMIVLGLILAWAAACCLLITFGGYFFGGH